MTLELSDCQKLKTQIDAIEDRLTEHALGEVPRDVSTATERVGFGNFSPSAARSRLAVLKKRYETGGCAVTLGKIETTPGPRAIRIYNSH